MYTNKCQKMMSIRWSAINTLTDMVHTSRILGIGPRRSGYFAVGITNSAPLGVLSGQRCMMDFCFV